MLYNGHFSIADTVAKNGWNHGQSLIEKPLYTDRNSGHLYIADTFLENGWNHGHSLIEKPLYSGQK